MLASVNRRTSPPRSRAVRSSTPAQTLDVDDLIELAQTELIGKRYDAAVLLLNRAVTLGSSAAAATLANLVTRGGLNVPLSSSPTNLSSFPSSSIGHRASSAPSTAAREAAIELLVQGLRHELAKPVKKTLRNLRGQSITLGSSSDEDGTEGRFFSLERVDDLGRALCDHFRHGGVSATTPNSSFLDTESLSARAERVVRQVLHHPSVGDERLRLVVAPAVSLSPDLPLTPSLVFAQHSARTSPPRRRSDVPLPTRSQSLPIVPTRRGTLLPTERKVQLSVQVHLLYTLALLVWKDSSDTAEALWGEILDIASAVGSSLGTKDADNLVAKAAHRLDHGVDTSWKLSKLKKRSNTAPGITPTSPTYSSASASIQSPDALVQMAHEKAANVPTDSYFQFADVFSSTTPGSSADTRTTTSSKYHLRESGYPSPPDTPTSSAPPSHQTSAEDKKTHPHHGFAAQLQQLSLADTRHPPLRRKASTASMAPPMLLRRVASQASISTLPANFGRPRAPWEREHATTTSSATADEASRLVDLVPLTMRTTSSPLSTPGGTNTNPMRPGKDWTTGFRQRLDSLRVNLPLVLPFQRKATPATASSLLRKVLVKDDETAEQLLYWEDRDLEEEQEDDAASSTAADSPARSLFVAEPSSPVPSLPDPPTKPNLSRHRSFVDPTSSSPTRRRNGSRQSSPVPQVIATPPTPEKSNFLAPPPTLSKRQQRRQERRASISSAPGLQLELAPVDPFLAELERNSRVGVKTICDSCGLEGLNFSRTRTGHVFCSRECRQLGPTKGGVAKAVGV